MQFELLKNLLLDESIDDKGIFKAIMVVGLPGAGKSYTISKLSGSISPRIVNSDKLSEFLAKKTGIEINDSTWQVFKDKTKRITRNNLFLYINSMLPLFVDGTSSNVSLLMARIGILQSVGYDVGMIYVKTDVDIAIKRAKERVRDTNRATPETFIRAVSKVSDENVKYVKSKVSYYAEIDNNEGMLTNAIMHHAFTETQAFFESALKNPVGNRIVKELRKEHAKYIVPTIMSDQKLKGMLTGWY